MLTGLRITFARWLVADVLDESMTDIANECEAVRDHLSGLAEEIELLREELERRIASIEDKVDPEATENLSERVAGLNEECESLREHRLR